MPPRSREPGPGQVSFDGEEIPQRLPVNVDRSRNALSRTLSFEYMQLDEADYMDVRPHMLELVRPDALRPFLIDVPLDITKSPSAASYTDRSTKRERNIALTDREAKLLPRFVGAIQRNAAINVGAAVTSEFPTDADIARKDRAKLHVQRGKLPQVIKYQSMLTEQKVLLDKFSTASRGKNVGLSMFGDEKNMRERFAYLQTFIIGDMVKAYANQHGLDAQRARMVDKAITVSILYHPNKVENFHELIGFLREYNLHRQELAAQRIESMTRNIGRALV
jgi:hypothetical protein